MSRHGGELFRISDYRQRSSTIYFSRRELDQLLSLYSRHVIRGEWRDYAIDHRDGFALFSVFRRSQESAAFTIMKRAGGCHGDFLVFSGRQKLRAGDNLAEVLDLFHHRPGLTVAVN